MTTKEELMNQTTSFAKENINLFVNLRTRWQDEKEYEDFKEYSDAMAKQIPNNWTFVKATKQPFGIVATVPVNDVTVEIKIYLKVKGNYLVMHRKTRIIY